MFDADNLVEKRILVNRNRRLILAIDHRAKEFAWLTQTTPKDFTWDEITLPEWTAVDSGRLPVASLDILIETWQCQVDTPNDILVTKID